MNTDIVVVAQSTDPTGLVASYDRAFRELGLTTTLFDLPAQTLESTRLVSAPPFRAIGRMILGQLDLRPSSRKSNRVLVRKVCESSPRLVFAVGGDLIRAATLVAFRVLVPGVKLVNVYPDMVFNIDGNLFQALPMYDRFLCHTEAAVQHLRDAGIRGAGYIPLAADPSLHHPVELNDADRQQFSCDVVYAGNYRPEYEEYFEALRGLDLAIWGSTYWHKAKSHWIRSRYRGRAIFGIDYVKAHIAAKVCLNPIDPLDVPGHNMRTFELPACRVFSIVQRTEEVVKLFREGETVECFEGAAELRRKIDSYLTRSDDRARIAGAAYEHVVHGGHTYVDRAREILSGVGLSDLIKR